MFVRGRKARSKDALLNEFSAALQFPPQYGENWDAFEEDIDSLEWIGAPVKTLVILETECVLRDASSHDKKIFFDILRDAPANHAAEWRSRGNVEAELRIIFQCNQNYAQELAALVRGDGA